MTQTSLILVLLLILFPLLGCKNSGTKPEPLPTHDSAIIFVPGFYGSSLYDMESGDQVFMTLGQLLWGKTPLALHQPDLGVAGARPLRLGEVIDDVGVVPWLYSRDVYGGFLSKLKKNFSKENEIVLLAYDWRLDNRVAIKALAQTVNELRAKGVKKIAIVAHSMGGLITSYYLRYGEQDFALASESWEGLSKVDAVVLAGVPFGGMAHAFRNLQRGAKLLSASAPLSAPSLSTFPSMYQLLPVTDIPVFTTVSEQDLTPQIYDPKIWKKNRWGIHALDADSDNIDLRLRRERATRDYLESAKMFSAKIRSPAFTPVPRELPVLSIRGKDRSTFTKFFWDGSDLNSSGRLVLTPEDSKTIPELKNRRFAFNTEGDSTVALSSSELPSFMRGLDVRSEWTAAAHSEIYGDKKNQKHVDTFLREQGF